MIQQSAHTLLLISIDHGELSFLGAGGPDTDKRQVSSHSDDRLYPCLCREHNNCRDVVFKQLADSSLDIIVIVVFQQGYLCQIPLFTRSLFYIPQELTWPKLLRVRSEDTDSIRNRALQSPSILITVISSFPYGSSDRLQRFWAHRSRVIQHSRYCLMGNAGHACHIHNGYGPFPSLPTPHSVHTPIICVLCLAYSRELPAQNIRTILLSVPTTLYEAAFRCFSSGKSRVFMFITSPYGCTAERTHICQNGHRLE